MPPLDEYRSRLARWRQRHAVLHRQFIGIGNVRLLLGISEAVLAWLALKSHIVPMWLLLIPLAAFIVLVVWHLRVIRRRTFAERAIRYYERGLARLEDRWQGTGNLGDRFRDPVHPYAEDLDLFGRGSLFDLVSAVRTKAGEDTLAAWLLAPATPQEATARQEAVAELRSRLDLREDLSLLGEDASSELDIDVTKVWASSPPIHFHPMLRWSALLFAVAGVAGIIAFFAQVLPLWPVLGILLCDFSLMYYLRPRIERVNQVIDTAAHSLRIVSLLLERLERERFESSKLRGLSADLHVEDLPASKRIAHLEHWIDWLDSSDHILARVIRPILLWREQIAMAVEAWRQRNGALAVRWIKCMAEFEALSSFAGLAFERPDWCFPAFDDSRVHFVAQDLRHPLLSPVTCVPNDVAFRDGLQLLIVSGSNMSGKSTLLRSIGLNTVLAWAGAPVAARRLELSPLHVASSMRVVDSLQDSRSRFYAEITRIRQIFNLLKKERTVLFLLDELLSGTNSHDRLLGATGIVRNLVQSGAIGLLTTHDLALAELERNLGARARNVHFDDQMIGDQIEFDYKLKPGVVTRSNAIELMRAVGLQV
jgi:hypothetical protein